GLAVTGTTSSTASLSWTASTDDVRVAAYDVLRDGVVVGSTARTTYTDEDLDPETTYRYTVRARDAAGNLSPVSLAAEATTLADDAGPEPGACTAAYRTTGSW